MNIILHIGSDKTGTTAIQSSLHKHRAYLETKGIVYPKLNKSDHHGSLAVELNTGQQGSAWGKLHTYFNKKPDTIILSSEMFCAISDEKIITLREWLRPYQLSVICYLRSADEYLESGLVQRLKNCSSDKEFSSLYWQAKWLPAIINPLVYQAALKPRFVLNWMKNLDSTPFIVRPYFKEEWYQGTIISDFIHSLSLDIKIDDTLTKQRNITPNVDIAYMFHLLKISHPELLKNEFSDAIVKELGQEKSTAITSFWKRSLAKKISTVYSKKISGKVTFKDPASDIGKDHYSPSMKHIRLEASNKLKHYIERQGVVKNN